MSEDQLIPDDRLPWGSRSNFRGMFIRSRGNVTCCPLLKQTFCKKRINCFGNLIAFDVYLLGDGEEKRKGGGGKRNVLIFLGHWRDFKLTLNAF